MYDGTTDPRLLETPAYSEAMALAEHLNLTKFQIALAFKGVVQYIEEGIV